METKTCLKSFLCLLCRLEWELKILQFFYAVMGRYHVDMHRMCFVVRDEIRRIVSALERLLRDVWNLNRYGRFNSLFAATRLVNPFSIASFFSHPFVPEWTSQAPNLIQQLSLLIPMMSSPRKKATIQRLDLLKQNKSDLQALYPGCVFVCQNPRLFV